MNRFLSTILSALLLFMPVYGNSEQTIAKSADNAPAAEMPKPKNIDKSYGQKGTLNESKTALISVDSLALQNYAKVANNFNFSTYDKVTLKSAILETLSQSNDLKSANEKVIQTELEYKDAYTGYLPTMDFQYSIKTTHNSETGDTNIDKAEHKNFNDESYKFTIRQSLYTGGATEFKIKSLQSKVEEAKRKYTIVLEQEIQKAIKAYFDVLFSHKSVVINERNMEKLNKILEITQIKYDSGALSIGDLSAVKANIANASGKLIKVKSDLADAIDFYFYTLGEDFVKTAPYEENFPITLTTLEALYEDILENNLGLVNYRLNIQSTKDKLLNMKATFKPKVDLELNYKNVLDKESFATNEETYDAKVTLGYNLYNGGKDTNVAMQVFSSLQELNYRYKEEVKKLKWEIAKLYNSIKSLGETITNTQKEVAASSEMVNSYWEGFQLGEQDLQVLLQGQRQLNGAELELIKFQQDNLTNIFKLLSSKGELSKYFSIDGNHPDYIDFSNTSSIKPTLNLDLSAQKKINKATDSNKQDINKTDANISLNKSNISTDLNSTMDEYLEVVKESSFEDIVNFKDKFLEADDENYTVVISEFTNHYDAYIFAKKNRMLDKTFSYEYFNKNGDFETNNSKVKVINVKTNLAYGIYNTVEEANKDINNIFDKGQKVFKVVKIKDIKELYNTYVNGLETKVEPFIVKPKVIKTFMTNQEFKNKFLSAPSTFYSINIVSLSQMDQAEQLIKEENIEKNAFVFRYGRNGMWIKVMYGVFQTYEQALTELSKHPEMLKKYRPVIEKIGQKQDTYNTYKDFNPAPQWYLDELKEKKEKKETKITPKVDEKKTNSKVQTGANTQNNIIIDEPISVDAKKTAEPKLLELPIKSEVSKSPDDTIVLKEEQPKIESVSVLPPQSQMTATTEEMILNEPRKATKTPELLVPIVETELPKQAVATPVNIEEPVKTEIKSGESQPLVSITTPKRDTPAMMTTMAKIEVAQPAEAIQNKAIQDEVIQTNNDENTTLESKIVTEAEPVKEVAKLQNTGNSTFAEALNTAPKEYYTIALESISDSKRDIFKKEFTTNGQFMEVVNKGKINIFYGIFKNIDLARIEKFKLNPELINSIKLYKIGRIDKKLLAEMATQKEEINYTVESKSIELFAKNEVSKPLDDTIVFKEEQPKIESVSVLLPQSQMTATTKEMILNEPKKGTKTPELPVPIVEAELSEQVVATPVNIEKPIKTEIKSDESQPLVSITTPKIDTPAMMTTMAKIEVAQPAETIQNKAIQDEVIQTNNDGNTTLKSKIATEAEPVKEVAKLQNTGNEAYKKEAYRTFSEAFTHAPKEYYTIELGTIPNKQKDAFIKRFIIGDQFIEISKKGQTKIYYGIFDTSRLAEIQTLNLHPKLTKSVKIIKIGKVDL